jgi:hypothetical protein
MNPYHKCLAYKKGHSATVCECSAKLAEVKERICVWNTICLYREKKDDKKES